MNSDREVGSDLPLPRQFRFDAGSAALNLLATKGYRGTDEPVERLTSTVRLRDWLAANELPAGSVDARGLAATRDLRESAYRVLAARMQGRAPARRDVALLGEVAARPLPGPQLRVRAGKLQLVDPPADLDVVLVGLARELAERAVAGAPSLRCCASDRCRMIYLDRSRGQRRRWCSMGRCGNLEKAAQHRARVTSRG